MELLIWTENYWIGGCDRFLVDFVAAQRERPVSVTLAGNPHPRFDAWLAERVPWVLPRTVLPVANLVDTPLHRLDRFRGERTTTMAAAAIDTASEPLPWRAGIALARHAQATLNRRRLVRLFSRLRPDVLLINNGGYPGGESCRAAALAARDAGIARVVHFVHNMASPPAWPESMERAYDRRIDAATDAWLTAAHRASDALSRERGIARNRVETVHYGIAPALVTASPPDPTLRAELGWNDDQPRVAVVANLEPRKGLDVLLDAVAQLRDSQVTLPTAIVGAGPLHAGLRARIAALGLGTTVRLLGWRDDVDAILGQATMLALPSVANECLPYGILEAMTHALPVVATDVAGIPEMVLDGHTGRVVSPGDPASLAAALGELASDPERAAALGRAGLKHVQAHFTLAAMVDAMAAQLGIE